MKKILIIGAGAMGSAFAVPCVENKNDVTIVGTHLEDNLIKDIISKDHLHPGLKTKVPREIKFVQFNELQPLLEKDLDLIVAGISSIGIEWFAQQISKNYKKKYLPPESYVKLLKNRFTPYCSVATWYLWRSIDPEPIQY